MKFIDLFSGIGGFRTALEKNGHECIAYSEIDKYAKKSYQAIYDTENEIDLGDITQISQEYLSKFKEENDIVVGGSPCQSFSIAGGRRGFEDTRGTLFFEYAKVVKETQPKIFLYENVKGMLSHDKQNTIKTVLSTFDELGYYIDFNVFNSKFYDVPQNRERIYIVGIRKDLIKNPIPQEESKGKKKFDEIHNWAVENINYKKILPPLKDNVSTRLFDILEKTVDEKFFLSEDKISQLTLNEDFSGKLNHYNYNELDKVHSIYKEAPTLNTMQGGGRQPKIAIKDFKEIVKVRKYEVDKQKLKTLLKEHKTLSNKEIAEQLNQPITKVEHWFRNDNSFSIPDANVWYELKELLNIQTDEFDKSITTFIEKESDYDTTNRVYDTQYISPTLNTSNEPKVAVIGNTSNTHHNSHNVHDVDGLSPTIAARDYKGPKQIVMPMTTHDENKIRVRKLTPLECWRLQGFSDEQFYKAKNDGVSNSQLYKQAGNSVTVNVVDYIISNVVNKIDKENE